MRRYPLRVCVAFDSDHVSRFTARHREGYLMARNLYDVLLVRERRQPRTGTLGRQTDWLEFCTLRLSAGRLLVCDAQFVPGEESGMVVDLPPGEYTVEARVIEYKGWWSRDRRVSRARVYRNSSVPLLGRRIGQTWTDTAATGFCDYDALLRWSEGDEAFYHVVDRTMETADKCGIAVYDAATDAVVPYVTSGFGDGEFPVFELIAGGRRVGIEVEFIEPDAPYPF